MESLPADWYWRPEVYERERRLVFGRSWLCVGSASGLAAPGDVVPVEVAGWRLLVLMDDAGELRGFHNVCLHRAGPLVEERTHVSAALACKYHGWTYGLDGRLVRARDFGCEVEGSLTPVRVERWRGLLFVCLDPEALPLVTSLGAFAGELDGFPLESFTCTGEVTHVVEANWKAYADNYLEGYHIPFVHPELTKEIDVRRYTVEVVDDWCRHTAPARDGSPTVGRWLWRFPNLAVNVYPDGMNVERFVPDGPRRTKVIYTYFFADPSSEAAAESERLSAVLLEEDRRICEAVQRNLETGAYAAGPLSPKHEAGVAAFQARLRQLLQ